MSKKKRRILYNILRRDNSKCGIHTGGCGELINRKEATIDHILPQSYFKGNPNESAFENEWNYQPMHELCNNRRRGQVINWIPFKCTCHGIYIKDDRSRWIMYKDILTNQWYRELFLKGPHYTSSHKEKGLSPSLIKNNSFSIKMKETKDKKFMGYSIHEDRERGVPKIGHIFAPVQFYERIILNSTELERTEQWKYLSNEIEIFSKNWLLDEGKGLKKEYKRDNGYLDVISKFLYWMKYIQGYKFKEAMEPYFKQTNKLLKKIEFGIMKEDTECLMIKNLIEKQCKGYQLQFNPPRNECMIPLIGSMPVDMDKHKKKEENIVRETVILLENGSTQKAVELLSDFISQNSLFCESAISFLVQIKINQRKFHEAEKYINDAIRYTDKNPVFYFLRGHINRNNGNIEKAERDIEKSKMIIKSNHKGNFVQFRTNKVLRKEVFEEKISEELLSIEIIKICRRANDHFIHGKFKETIYECDIFFEKYNKYSKKNLTVLIYKKNRAIIYSMRFLARILLKEKLYGLYRLLSNEQEMEKEIWNETHNRNNDYEELSKEIKKISEEWLRKHPIIKSGNWSANLNSSL